MSDTFNILAIGDIVRQESVKTVLSKIRGLKQVCGASLVIANGENAAKGNGLDRDSAESLLNCGIDVITSGNHIWQKREIYDYLDDSEYLLRPANYPPEAPGKGFCIYETDNRRVLVMNVMGTVFLDPLDCPFKTVEKILESQKGRYDFSVLDIHAEATSEKLAMANYFDGKINVIFGTHTHVVTADERIFPKGTGYITDIGMTGPVNSVLGVKPECIIEKLRSHLPVRFETAEGEISLSGALFSLDKTNGRVLSVERVKA